MIRLMLQKEAWALIKTEASLLMLNLRSAQAYLHGLKKGKQMDIKIREKTWSLFRADALIREITIPKPYRTTVLPLYPPTQEGRILSLNFDTDQAHLNRGTTVELIYLMNRFKELYESGQDFQQRGASLFPDKCSGVFNKPRPKSVIKYRGE